MKMMARVLVVLLAALPVLAAPPKPKPQPKPPAWKTYSSSDGRFSIQFPGAPTATVQQDRSPLGQVTTNIFTCPVSYGTFTVTYSDLPSIAASFAQGEVFDGARDGLLSDAKASAVSYTDWQHGEDDAKDLVYKSSAVQGHAWLIMVSSRLYVLDARVKVGTPAAASAPFFKSLNYSPAP